MNWNELRKEIREKTVTTFSRSGGPGGQNVNKRDTKVTARLPLDSLETPDPASLERLRHRLASRISSEGSIVIQVDTHRSQGRNREEALERMETLVRAALRPNPRPRKATAPSRASRERRLESKKRRSSVKASRRKPSGSED